MDHHDIVVEKLTECQGRLFAYIYSLTANADRSWDILQETNRVLWRRAEMYDASLDFVPWALKHAFNQVRASRQQENRDRHVYHEDATLQSIAEAWNQKKESPAARLVALEKCRERLKPEHRDLVKQFYDEGHSLAEIAKRSNKKENAISVALHRIRQLLADCIQKRLA